MSLNENDLKIPKTAPLKVSDDSMKANAQAADNMGLEVRVSREYDGVGLHGGRDACNWCIERCGENMSLNEAYAKGAFQRHPGCGCIIEYTSATGETTRQGRDWKWSEYEKEQRIQQMERLEKTGIDEFVEFCQSTTIENRPVSLLERTLTDSEIIEKIGGGDMTNGSCSSLAFTYIGNASGYDVTDFRGGLSCNVFSRGGWIEKIADSEGIISFTMQDYNGIKCANNALKCMEQNKLYYFATGQHAAVVKLSTEGYQYLELQTATSNGWKKLTTNELKQRFGVRKSVGSGRYKMKQSARLIDAESLGSNNSFKDLLGYINTESGKQQKGARGFAK